MSDLISRRELINFLRTENQKCITSTGYELSFGVIATLIECQPIAYDPGKVVEELEKNKRKLFSFAKDYSEIGNPEMAEIYEDRAGEYIKAIEIVKQGGVAKTAIINCANYTEPDEVDNGCYLCCKGYENNYEPKVDNGGVSDDVCKGDRFIYLFSRCRDYGFTEAQMLYILNLVKECEWDG